MKTWLVSRCKRLWNKIVTSPRKITIPAGVLLLALICAGVFGAVRYWNYMETSPQFCKTCHIMQPMYNKWAVSVHNTVTCHDCHQQSIFESSKQLVDYVFLDVRTVDKTPVIPNTICAKCHESGNPQWIQISDTAGHIVHATQQKIACTTCHATAVHVFQAPTDICTTCHKDQKIQITAMASLPCSSCHDYLAKNQSLLPDRATCLTCHADKANHNPGIVCSTCHQVHPEPVNKPSS